MCTEDDGLLRAGNVKSEKNIKSFDEIVGDIQTFLESAAGKRKALEDYRKEKQEALDNVIKEIKQLDAEVERFEAVLRNMELGQEKRTRSSKVQENCHTEISSLQKDFKGGPIKDRWFISYMVEKYGYQPDSISSALRRLDAKGIIERLGPRGKNNSFILLKGQESLGSLMEQTEETNAEQKPTTDQSVDIELRKLVVDILFESDPIKISKNELIDAANKEGKSEGELEVVLKQLLEQDKVEMLPYDVGKNLLFQVSKDSDKEACCDADMYNLTSWYYEELNGFKITNDENFILYRLYTSYPNRVPRSVLIWDVRDISTANAVIASLLKEDKISILEEDPAKSNEDSFTLSGWYYERYKEDRILKDNI